MAQTQLRQATPDDKVYVLQLTDGLQTTLLPAEKRRLQQFNAAVKAFLRKNLSEIPVMPVRNMRMDIGFKYGLPAANHGFTMATNYFDVLLNSVAREMAIFPCKTGNQLCPN